ncbi:cysteine hydrolase [Streptomyces sp. PTM05]|uniref:Cysteine hydrolase n=1 Tax=Streptantibioticus parmotrematis TaxID=2873249 RepID=A0ABS7QPR1_9ACTN|nr:cysteine hydrolase [Streptantibioticus parmotrematis]MBY8885174.1 cysteine hydrolase [Streptantibioticus parmotrematis]
MTTGTGTALIVVDMQNDFCAGPVAGSRYRGDPARLAIVTANVVRAVDVARRHGTQVVFVRFLGDVAYQGASWRQRDRALGKRPKCLDGSWGAAFHQVAPAPGEMVFTKRACFDAFLSDGFEPALTQLGVERLVFAGLYTDVCVDSTARTAFQKGYHVTVLTDCTASLHLPDEEILRFMRLVYGAHVTTHDRPESWSGPASGEDMWSARHTATPERTDGTTRRTNAARTSPETDAARASRRASGSPP